MGARTSARHSFTLFHEATAFKGASEGGTSASERAGKTPSISSWLGSLRAPRGAVLDAREHDKKPIRDIATWLPVTLYILNDVLNGTFTLLPYVMAFNGWIGGLAIIWGIGCINYYVGNVLYRCSQIFPGAVSLGDLSYYLTRSTAVMVLTFLLSYLLMFTTNAQQFTMAANMLQVSKHACVRACVRACVGALLPLPCLHFACSRASLTHPRTRTLQFTFSGLGCRVYQTAWLVFLTLFMIPLTQVSPLHLPILFPLSLSLPHTHSCALC